MMNISWKRVWILIKKWRLFIISSAIAVLSLIFVIKTYGETNESCKLINDIAVSFFSGALFADVTFFVEIRIATQKEWQQFANVISKYIFELDKKIFELEKENILTEDRNRIRELEHINECIGEMIDEIRQYNMIYFLKAYQMEVFLGKLLCVIERYLEIIKKEEKIEKQKKLFSRLMKKLIIEKEVPVEEAAEVYPYDSFCENDLDEVDKLVLNGMSDSTMNDKLKICDDSDLSHGTEYSFAEKLKKRYNIVNYYIVYVLPKEHFLF